jgi:putative tryptophan/tyrosine transport system substrate-binding protein
LLVVTPGRRKTNVPREARREFIALLGSAAVAWPLAARAQQSAVPVIGWLDSGRGQPSTASSAAFRKGLGEIGYVEGHNVTIEYRGGEHYEQLRASAADLVRRRVSVIFATETVNSAQAAKMATATIPIVFQNGGDPVRLGLVASLNRPGGNATGLAVSVAEMVAKRLELLRELVPQADTMGYLTNPTNLISVGETADMQTAARSVGQQMMILRASTVEEIDTALATAAKDRLGALLVGGDGLLFNRRAHQITALAAHYRIPASYPTRVYAESGGLMSYGDNRFESWRLSGIYVGRILKGDKPADLPVLQPTKFELVINLKTAKALGLEFPPTLLALADEVIE